ncbi:MAG: Glu-tRNA(Gln) amidotransferase subunit GatD [Candidatus Micrarchaeaceae archaeon]
MAFNIDGLLGKAGIHAGDRILIESKSRGIRLEGELMPKTENNAADILVIKLPNGYNIGIRSSADMRIEKIAEGRMNFEFPKSTASPLRGKPKVQLIYTGGTIGSKIDYKTGGVHMLLKPEELLYEVPELEGIADIEVKQLFNIASEDMSYVEWQRIAKEVAEALNRGKRGAIITTGTDTMHYIASALSFMLGNTDAPVVITGAQRSSDRGSSDAFLNLSCAAKLAAYSNIAEVGICMHASSSDSKCAFIRGVRARKMHTTRRDAFRAINDKPIAYVGSSLDIEYAGDYRRTSGKNMEVKAQTGFEKKVALVKAYPNSDPGIIEFYMGKGYKGIIIEGTGMGHTPVSTEHEGFSWLPEIKKAIDSGIVVGMTSQCLYGRVNPNVYRNLRLLSNAGVIYCEDMLPETAYVKLGWLLGNYGAEEARELLSKNIAGEISKRSKYDNFLV